MKIEVVNNKDYWDLPDIHSFTITLIPENEEEKGWVKEDQHIEAFTREGKHHLIISGKVSSIVMKEEK